MIPALGATSLGIFMGWLVRYFIFRFREFTPQILGATVTVILGGAVIGFLNGNDNNSDTVWFYPIGLLIGSIMYSISGYVTRNKQNPDSARGIAFYASVDVEEEDENA